MDKAMGASMVSWLICSPSRTAPCPPMYWSAGNHWQGDTSKATNFCSDDAAREHIAFMRFADATPMRSDEAVNAAEWLSTWFAYQALKEA